MGMDNPGQILARLREREGWFRLRIFYMLTGGLGLSLLAPALISVLFWLAYYEWRQFGHAWGEAAPWWWFFAGCCVVVIPLLYRMEIKAQGPFLVSEAKEFDAKRALQQAKVVVSFDQVGMIAAALAHPRATVSGLSEVFLFGPRLVVRATRQIRLRRLARQADRNRAAIILQALAAAPGHVPTESLLKETELQQSLARVLAYLLFFDWIGVSHDGDKAWMPTEAREALHAAPGALGVTTPA